MSTTEEKTIDQTIEVHFSYEKELERVTWLFEEKIAEYLSKYPPSEILTFETKRVEAEKFVADGENYYIETLASAKNIEPLVLAETILEKAKVFAEKYASLEAWKDSQVKAIKVKYNVT